MKTSPIYKNIPPIMNPERTINHVWKWKLSAISIAGFNREKKEAEIIMPADNANITFKKQEFIFLNIRTSAEPNKVIKKVKHPAKKAKKMGWTDNKKESIISPIYPMRIRKKG